MRHLNKKSGVAEMGLLGSSHTNFADKQRATGGRRRNGRVRVQGVKSLAGHFACLCRGIEFYEVKKMLLFLKKKMEILLHFLSFL